MRIGRKPAVQPAERHHTTIVAAATNVDLKNASSWQMFKLGDHRWQLESWRHYDICGEMRFVINWVGQALSRCRMYVADITDDGTPGDETTNKTAQHIVDSMFGGPATKAEAQRLMGINMLVAGECYIVCENKENEDHDTWYIVSSSEIFRTGDDITVRRSMTHGGGKYVLDPDKDLLIRAWTPHPRVYDACDSTVRAVLPVLREIEQSTKRVFAEIDSRLAGAGILPLPQSIDFPREEGEDTSIESFFAVLQRTMATSLQQRDSAAAVVPILMTVPDDVLGKIAPINFANPVSEQIMGLREKAVVRLAMALDVPPEVLTGMGGASHWNAWQVEESTIKIHIEPLLIRIADALNVGYLQPALKAANVRNPEKFTLWFDVSPLAVRPNRSDQALQYQEKGLLSAEATRNYGDFTDDDKPSDDEILDTFLRQLVLAQPNYAADPEIQRALGLPAIQMPAPAAAPMPPDLSGGLPEYDENGNPITNSEPADAATRQLPTTSPEGDALAGSLYFIADSAVHRALELVGGKTVPARDRITRYANTPRHELHTHVWVDPQKLPTLLAGAFDLACAQAAYLGVNADSFGNLLEGYVTALVTNRTPHQRELLRSVLNRARR